jgi:hypothetical protein
MPMSGAKRLAHASRPNCKTVSGLLISWATPATSVPSAVSFSACATEALRRS